MREASVSFARMVAEQSASNSWDAVFTTDMLNVAELQGLCPAIQKLPVVVYFHENQLTYPVSDQVSAVERQRDTHFAFSNFVSANAASAVWFNSKYHRHEFLTALEAWLQKMPDGNFAEELDQIRAKSVVEYPGIQPIGDGTDSGTSMDSSCRTNRTTAGQPDHAALRIAWVSRWEHDKAPEVFFAALRILKQSQFQFRLNVLGESYRRTPECFAVAREEFAEEIDHWGYLESETAYANCLRESDVVVSTARHEFFGIAVLEAVSAGCLAVVPNCLAYPEVLTGDYDSAGGSPQTKPVAVFHNNTPAEIAKKIRQAASMSRPAADWGSHFAWPQRSISMDNQMEIVVRTQRAHQKQD